MLLADLEAKVILLAGLVDNINGEGLAGCEKSLNNRLILRFKAVDPDRVANISEGYLLGADEILELLLPDLVLLSRLCLLLFQVKNLEDSVEFLNVGNDSILVIESLPCFETISVVGV